MNLISVITEKYFREKLELPLIYIHRKKLELPEHDFNKKSRSLHTTPSTFSLDAFRFKYSFVSLSLREKRF